MVGISSEDSRYAPRFEVEIGDRTLSEPGNEIADLVVETTLTGADRFECTLAHPFAERRESFRDLSWDRFEAGTDVAIDAGYAGGGSLTPLVVGRIDSVTADFGPGRGPSVRVAGFGRLQETMEGTRSDSWTETTLGNVVDDVLSTYDFTTVEVEDADIRRERLVQHAQTDYGFLSDLASTYGHSLHARRKTVRFVPESSLESSGSPDATLTYGEGLARFSAESSSPPTGVELRAWNPESAAVDVVTETGSGSTGSTGGVGRDTGEQTRAFTVPNMPKREAKRIAAAHTESETAVTGHGQADGDPAVQAGATVQVDGVGERFSGTYLVTSATHRLGSDGYGTTFQCREVPA